MVKQRRGVRMAVLLACVATTIAMTVVDASARTVPIFTRNGPVGDCPHAGHLTYTLDRVARPTAEQAAAYRAIGTAMDQALAVYNCHSDLTRSLWVSYDPAVPTADGSDNGSISHLVAIGAHWIVRRFNDTSHLQDGFDLDPVPDLPEGQGGPSA